FSIVREERRLSHALTPALSRREREQTAPDAFRGLTRMAPGPATIPPAMKLLFVSLSGLIGDIAWQAVKEGHDVKYSIDDEKEHDIADGFVPKSTSWEADVDWA